MRHSIFGFTLTVLLLGAGSGRHAGSFIRNMVATGELRSFRSSANPPVRSVTLHNVMETSEGPPNGPMLEVYERTGGELDGAIAVFQTELALEMAQFEELTGVE